MAANTSSKSPIFFPSDRGRAERAPKTIAASSSRGRTMREARIFFAAARLLSGFAERKARKDCSRAVIGVVRERGALLLQLRQEGQGLISAPQEVDQKGGVEDGHQRSTAIILADRSSRMLGKPATIEGHPILLVLGEVDDDLKEEINIKLSWGYNDRRQGKKK
jgi:hypothetical protein